MFASSFTWFHLIPWVDHEGLFSLLGVEGHGTYVFALAWLACFLVLGWAVMARRGLEAARARGGMQAYYADSSLTVRNSAEIFASGILSLIERIFPSRKDLARFFPLIASLFLYIWVCNLFSLVPGMSPPTDDINANVGMAVVVFLVFNYVGLTRDAVGYVKHLWGPMLVTGFLLFPIEVISLFIRPVSLTLRLTGNMFGDHTVFSVMSGLLPDMAAGASPVVQAIAWLIPIPVPFLALALLVSTMQALVFSLLTSIYVGSAIPHHDHGDHGHGDADGAGHH
jgi:F-type H+-transporting ATPase subunit a